jgi:prepilin-type N-terminal cleavage/methylation domain-containing protein
LRTNGNTGKGFTLLELLLVVTVIAMVAALLLPALSSAKSKARRSVCLNNLRQLNLGVRMFADNSNDTIPAPIKDNGPPNCFTVYAKLAANDLGENAALFACPADTFHYDYNERISEAQHLQARSHHSSYAFNGGNFPLINGIPRWPGIAGRKLNSIREPAKTVLVAEFAALYPYSWHQPSGASGHYNDARNIASFVDGHVRFIKMYWDAANVGADHHEAWQYDPPWGYDYKWSGD